MGRFKIASVISVALLLGVVACHKGQPLNAASCPAGTWCQIGTGIWFAYIPNFTAPSGSTYPEFGVLRMTDQVYQAFHSACTGGTGATYLNKYPVFANKLNVVLSACPYASAPQNGSPYWYVAVPHWPNSTAAAAGYPETAP